MSRDEISKMTGPELWRRCWDREDREKTAGRYKQNHRSMQHEFAEDLYQVQRVGRRVRAYAMFRYHALSMRRNEGWAAHFYKSVWGEWPPYDWRAVPPMQPTGAVKRLIETRDRRWIKEQKLKAWREEKVAIIERIWNENEQQNDQ